MKNLTKLYIIIGGLALLMGVLLFLDREPLPQAARESYNRLADRITETDDYYEVNPEGIVRGGILIFPDSGEDPISYAPLAEQLVAEGLTTRLVKYPLKSAALSKTERLDKDITGDLSWVTMGFGKGQGQACILADRVEKISGLIIIGDCKGSVNLKDNDIRVSFFELAEEPLDAEAIAAMMKRLPADTVFITASSLEEILGSNLGNPELAKTYETRSYAGANLVREINRILK